MKQSQNVRVEVPLFALEACISCVRTDGLIFQRDIINAMFNNHNTLEKGSSTAGDCRATASHCGVTASDCHISTTQSLATKAVAPQSLAVEAGGCTAYVHVDSLRLV